MSHRRGELSLEKVRSRAPRQFKKENEKTKRQGSREERGTIHIHRVFIHQRSVIRSPCPISRPVQFEILSETIFTAN